MANQIKKLFSGHPSVEFEGDTYKHMPTPGYCGVCGRKTHFKSVYTTEYCCSEQCSRELWHDVFMYIIGGKKTK